MRQDDKLREDCKTKIRKKYAGNVVYSDIIGNDRKEIRLWNLITTRLHNRRVDTRKIRRLMLQVQQPTALCMDHEAVDKAKTATMQRYKEHKKI
jgi:hypothetical protein